MYHGGVGAPLEHYLAQSACPVADLQAACVIPAATEGTEASAPPFRSLDTAEKRVTAFAQEDSEVTGIVRALEAALFSTIRFTDRGKATFEVWSVPSRKSGVHSE